MTTVTIEAQCKCAERIRARLNEALNLVNSSKDAETIASLKLDIAALRTIQTVLKMRVLHCDGCARLLSTRFPGGRENG